MLINTSQAAAILNRSQSHVNYLVHKGILTDRAQKSGRHNFLIDSEQVHEYGRVLQSIPAPAVRQQSNVQLDRIEAKLDSILKHFSRN